MPDTENNTPRGVPCVCFRFSALLMFLLFPAAAGAQTASDVAHNKAISVEPDREIVFKKTPQGKLRLHAFLPNDWKPTDRRSAIVFFFGGGWVGGSPKQLYPQARHLADQGMVAFSAEYRVNRRHKTSPFECVEDGKSAIRYIREHAAELGVDPERVAAGGASAGGHVAICTALIADSKEELSQSSSVPDAVIAFNPVVDTGPEGYGHNNLKDRYRELSPVEHVREKLPPMLIFHGTSDTTVPFESASRFGELMVKYGNDCQVVPFKDMVHGFFNFGRNENKPYLETLKLTDHFLSRLEYLPTDSDTARKSASPIHERIEWTDIWVTNADKNDLPRVLFVGDSITRGYFGAAEKELAGKADCGRLATSAFISHEDFLSNLKTLLKRYHWDVIHINNGLHGWEYTEEQYRDGFPTLGALLEKNAADATVIWAMTTPLRERDNLEKIREESNTRVRERNRIAAEFAKKNGYGTSDLFSLSIDHADHHRNDGTHFSRKGIALQGKFVGDIVMRVLDEHDRERERIEQGDDNVKWEALEYESDFESGAADWEFVDSGCWKIAQRGNNRVLSLHKKKGDFEPKVRSLYHMALLKQKEVGDFQADVRMLSTEPDYGHRDACFVFGYQSPTRYYYIHLGKKTDSSAHQIHIVDDKDRSAITLTNNSGTPWDDNWHNVRVRRDTNSGEIAVYFDNMDSPTMTAKDTTFTWGRVGLGSFDDTVDFDDFWLEGKSAKRADGDANKTKAQDQTGSRRDADEALRKKNGYRGLENPDSDLPNVLLVGDSICSGYNDEVRELLAGKANVYVWVTGMNIRRGNIEDVQRTVLAAEVFDVVHFNIGLHGLGDRIPEDMYEPLLRKYVANYYKYAGGAHLIWGSTTPIWDKKTNILSLGNAKIVKRNAVAARVMKENEIPVTELYDSVSDKLELGDGIHWSGDGYMIMAKTIVPNIEFALKKPRQKTENGMSQSGGKTTPKQESKTVANSNTPVTARPVPKTGRGWQIRHKAMSERVKQGNVDLVFIGDSITHFWDRKDQGLPVWNEYYGARNAVNLGISADRIQHVLWRLQNGNLDGVSPKVAVVMIGTNNSGSDSPEDIAAGVKAVVTTIEEKCPTTRVLILGIFPRGKDATDKRRIVNNKANEIISKFADNRTIFYMNIGDKMLEEDRALSREVMPDLLHPGKKGYEIWAEAIEEKLKKLLGEKK